MSNRPDTEIVAALLARGYNRHIKDHGPDGSYASEAMESGDGHAIMVERDGSQFAVRVERLPARTADAPLTPGQCWAALKGHLAGLIERDTAARATAEHPVDLAIASAIAAYQHVLATMAKLEG